MVRETRHLWVGNLPENIREEDIVEHFKRYGRVQSVKFVSRKDESSGCCATVSFMDIKSASKAHNVEQKLEDCALTTEYHEPTAIPRDASTIYSSPRSNHGTPEEINPFDRSSHFYGDGEAYIRRSSSTYLSSSADNSLRGRPRDRLYRNGPYPIIESVVSRPTPGSHHRSWNYEGTGRYTPPEHTLISPRRDTTTAVTVAIHRKKQNSKSRSGSNGSESGSNSISSGRSRSRSSSSSRSSSASSPHSSPSSSKTCSTHRSRSTLQSAVSTSSPGLHSDDRRPLAICVRNLPARSSDTSLKDGLYHEYKKHGKVSWVKIVGQGVDRYGLVCFKKADDAEKALQGSHDKHFFGCKIEVAAYHDVEDFEFRPYEAELDEFHPKATRTLFIGNLEKDISASELQKHFDQFGQIIFVDIKKQSSSSAYAFVQYTDIASVVRAMRAMDGEYVGNNRVNLGYGKSLATTCVWVDGIGENVSDKYLSVQFSEFGLVSHVEIDRTRGQALVFYQQVLCAQLAVNGMRGIVMRGRRLQVDFASRECQDTFYENSQKSAVIYENSIGASPQSSNSGGCVTALPVRGLDTPSSSSSSGGGSTSSSSRTYRHTNSRPSPISYTRVPSPTPLTPKRHSNSLRCDYPSTYELDRRTPYRSYEDAVIEEKMVVVIQQAPSEMRHQKERGSIDEMEETVEHRRKCKHRRSHSGENSRPGTPLCDERPEYLPTDSRNKHERSPVPLCRFSNSLSLSKPPPSPPPSPLVPPLRPHSTSSSSSEDSELSLPFIEWEEKLKSLDEKYEKWSGSRTLTAKVDSSGQVRPKFYDLNVHEPSDIVKSVLARPSIFDEDSKRLENLNDKYEPKENVPSHIGLQNFRSYLTPSLSTSGTTVPLKSAVSVMNKGLQYPFPSHPHVNNFSPRRDIVNHVTNVSNVSNPVESSKPIVPIPNNLRRNSTNSIGDTARRRSRDETLNETKNVNEIKLRVEPNRSFLETSTNKNVGTVPIPQSSESPKTPKPIPSETKLQTDSKSVESKPASLSSDLLPDVVPQDVDTNSKSIEVSITQFETKPKLDLQNCVENTKPTHNTAIIERRKSTSIDRRKEKEIALTDTKIECNNKASINHVSSVLHPPVMPKRKDCDIIETVDKANKERDAERDRRKNRESIDSHTSEPNKQKPNENSISEKDKKELPVKQNCVENHVRHKDRKDLDKDKRKEKENIEIKLNNQRKDHDSYKSKLHERRESKDELEERDRKKNNENSISKHHRSRDADKEFNEIKIKDVEHSSNKQHNSYLKKESSDKHKSDRKSESSRHRDNESKKNSEDQKKKENFDENSKRDIDECKKKENHEDQKRKEMVEETKKKDLDECKKKENLEDHKRKDVPEDNKKRDLDEYKKKENHEEHKRRETVEESRKKDLDECKKKDNHEDHKRKEIPEESKKKDLDECKKKENHEDHKRKEIVEETKKKDLDDFKKKDNHEDYKRRETVEESRKKDSDECKKKENHEEQKRKEMVEESRKKVLDECRKKENHEDHKRKEVVEESRKKDIDECRKKENHEDHKRKEVVEESRKKDLDECRKKENHEDHKRREVVEETKKKDIDECKKREYHEDQKRKEMVEGTKKKDDECKKKENHEEHKRKDMTEESRKKDLDECKRKEYHEDFKRKDSHEEKRKECHEDTKKKELAEESKRKELDECKKKENNDDRKRKDSHEEKRKEYLEDHKKKESVEEIRKKDLDDCKRKENHDDRKRKDSHEEKRKECPEDNKKRDQHEDSKRKDHDEVKRKESSEEKRKEILEDHRRKESQDEKRKEVHEDKLKEEKDSHKHNKDRDHKDTSDSIPMKHRDFDFLSKKSDISDIDLNKSKRNSDHNHHDSLRKKTDSERRTETMEKDKRKERHSFDSSETLKLDHDEKKKEFDLFKTERERKKGYDHSDRFRKDDSLVKDEKKGDCLFSSGLVENISDAEESPEKRNHIKKEQRKDRSSNSSCPATVGCKRRLSSQDSLDSSLDDIKRIKPERRDSKDSKDSNKSTSSSSSSKKYFEKHPKNVSKMLEEKIKEDKVKESQSRIKKENEDSDPPKSNHFKSEKKFSPSEFKISEPDVCDIRKNRRIKGIRENGLTTCSESETGSCDDESRKKHSIFDIVDDTPAYISMYDKVKARSCKNMQKHEEEKKQEKLKEKFNQLKQSRAKREEKKRSTSYEEDTDSERGIGRRNSKNMITSSEDDVGSEYELKAKSKKIKSDTSDDDLLKSSKLKIKSKTRMLRSEESELDTTQDSLQSFNKSDQKDSLQSFNKSDQRDSLQSFNKSDQRDSLQSFVKSEQKDYSQAPVKLEQTDNPQSFIEAEQKDHSFIKTEPPKADIKRNEQDRTSKEMSKCKAEENENEDSLEPLTNNARSNVDTDSDVHVKKRSHKKKEKRQKSLDSSLSFSDATVPSKKDKHKKERRKSHNHESDFSNKLKSRKKKNSHCVISKKDSKLENSLFEPLSDDSVVANKESTTPTTPIDNSMKWQVGQIYSDSDSDHEIHRLREKKRRERKSREMDEAGKALEAKLLDDVDHFESLVVEKVKKKKKKKKKHHNHHKQRNIEHEGDGDDEDDEIKSVSEKELTAAPPSPAPLPEMTTLDNQSLSSLLDSPPLSVTINKKPDIPGFGLPMDEKFHDSAVKSISEPETVPITKILPDSEPAPVEEKPAIIISQEETEDAVAALLEDAFGGDFDDYTPSENDKPGSPENLSEPDLQIDTDTEDNFDSLDFSKPPRTPDYPSYYSKDEKAVVSSPAKLDVKPVEPVIKLDGKLKISNTEIIHEGTNVNKEAGPSKLVFEPSNEKESSKLNPIDSRIHFLSNSMDSNKSVNSPVSAANSVLFTEQSLQKHNKTTELLAHKPDHDVWMNHIDSKKTLPNSFHKPVTSLEQTIHKTVNHVTQYINKSPKPASLTTTDVKTNSPDKFLLKANNNHMLPSYGSMPPLPNEQLYVKTVVLSEQYKNMQQIPEPMKNCLIPTEKVVSSASKSPSVVKSVITINKSMPEMKNPPPLAEILKPQMVTSDPVLQTTSVVQTYQSPVMTTAQTKPKENQVAKIIGDNSVEVPKKENNLSHLIQTIDNTIFKEPTKAVEPPHTNLLNHKEEDPMSVVKICSPVVCPLTIKKEDLIAKQKLEKLYSNIQPDKYQFGNKTLTITGHNFVVSSVESNNLKFSSVESNNVKMSLAESNYTQFSSVESNDNKLTSAESNNTKSSSVESINIKPSLVESNIKPSSVEPNNIKLVESNNIKLSPVDSNIKSSSVESNNVKLPSQPLDVSKPIIEEKHEEYKPAQKVEPNIVKVVEELEMKLNQEQQLNKRKASVEETRKQHLEMLDEELKQKREELVVPIIAPLTPKMEENASMFVSPGESSCEPKDVESAQTRKGLTDELNDKIVDEDSTARRGRRRKNNARIATGVPTRRTRFSNPPVINNSVLVKEPSLIGTIPSDEQKHKIPETKPLNVAVQGIDESKNSNDIYEFKDESDEEDLDRPRLVLTIKSPHDPVASVNSIPSTNVPESSSVVSTALSSSPSGTSTNSCISSPPRIPTPPLLSGSSASTRKSRRLQEKDVCRNTVDDTIDEVVRTARTVSTRRTTRSSLNTIVPPPLMLPEITRKSPRRKQQGSQLTQKQNEDSSPVGFRTPKKETEESVQSEENLPKSTSASTPPSTSDSILVTSPSTLNNTTPTKSSSLPQPRPVTSANDMLEVSSSVSKTITDTIIITTATTTSPSLANPLTTPVSSPNIGSVVSKSLPVVAPLSVPITQSVCSTPAPQKVDIDETMSLIDPVSGELIPVREAEGQYIPLQADGTRARPNSEEPAEKRLKLPTSTTSDVKSTSMDTLPIVVKAATITETLPKHLSSTSVNPVVTQHTLIMSRTIPIRMSSNSVSTNVVSGHLVASTSPIVVKETHPVLNQQSTKPTVVTHVPTLVVPSRVVTTTNIALPPKIALTKMVPNHFNKTLTVNVLSAASPQVGNVALSPKPNVLSPSMSKPNLSPGVVTIPQASVPKMAVVPPLNSHPINPKLHLLNRTKMQTPMTPKAHILQAVASVPAREPLKSVKPGTPSPGIHPVHMGVTPSGTARTAISSDNDHQRGQVLQTGLPLPVAPYEASMGEVINYQSQPHQQHPPTRYVHPGQLNVYHRYFREAALAPTSFHRTGGDDKEVEAEVSPPLELRRGSPHDRTTDSPQVATLYGSRILFYDPSHASGFQPAHHLTTPPHPSPETPMSMESLHSMLVKYPVMWEGELVLKTDQAFVQMYFITGSPQIPYASLPKTRNVLSQTLRIAQRMRLEPTQIDGVVRKMQKKDEHCMLLALPCGRTENDIVQQSTSLQSGFITYLQQKQAAGIVNIPAPGTQQPAYIVHVFPSCEFANNSLAQFDAHLLRAVSEVTYLVIIIATTGNNSS